MKQLYKVALCRYLLFPLLSVLMALSINKSFALREKLPKLVELETLVLLHHEPIYYSVLDEKRPYPNCPRQTACSEREYKAYLKYVPLYYRVCDECQLEMELRNSQGLPFMYHTINNTAYPTITFGTGLRYLCYPEFDLRKRYYLLVLVLSTATEIEERAVLRNYYNRLRANSTRFIFVTASNPEVNEAVARESRQFRDIIQLNHLDSYHNLTLSVFGALQLLSQDTSYAKYIMKTDSDCVLNLPRIEEKLRSQAGLQYAGNCRKNAGYYTTGSKRKNFVPQALIRDEKSIKQYATGAGYIIASSVLPRLVVAFRHLSFIAHNEDVNVGRAMSLIHVQCTMFWRWIARNGCTKGTCRAFSIIHSPNNWRRIWEMVLEF